MRKQELEDVQPAYLRVNRNTRAPTAAFFAESGHWRRFVVTATGLASTLIPIMIAFAQRENSRPFLASVAAFRCLMFAACE